MAKQILVFVHGVGDHPKNWLDAKDGPKAKLDAMGALYDVVAADGPVSEQIEIREIAYDFVFADIVKQWENSAEQLSTFATGTDGGAPRPVPKLVSWINKPLPSSEANAKNFFWSAAIDVLFYRGFELVRDRVRESVMSQLIQILKSAEGEAVNLTIVAHSLGTGVMHDVMHLLGTGQTPPSVGDTSMLRPPLFTVDAIFMLADICLLGPSFVRDIEPFGSICCPINNAKQKKGMFNKFYEVWHRFDPIATLAPFRPGDWGPGYIPIGPLSHFRQANVHGYTHYLDHPAVHIPLLNQALAGGGRLITAQQEAAACAKYGDIISPECTQLIEQLKAKTKEFAGLNDDLELLVIKISEFLALAKKIKGECSGMKDGDDQ